ncbi:MAG: bifunctional pyr operon transcriptional regulator/uracil phosphoribosyltransferase PyrR [Verrucomicrobia bacterium]|nr:bifunctional pyr operon transcriptional regulator/uracil phosphoribosyltransferase PyrR [Verrucomicrobiota bacterium]
MAEKLPSTEQLLTAQDVTNTVRRLAFQILERHPTLEVVFVGIHTRGVVLANRVAAVLSSEGAASQWVQMGTLDISFHRDDLDQLKDLPVIESTDIPFDLAGANVILFDDVIFTGRTIRSAIDCLMDFGRPARIELAVLVDRGNRELPIQPDYRGLIRETRPTDYVKLKFSETDGEDGLYLSDRKEAAK